ncbi:MAG: helix-turn-helix domain-containing protein, partial [Deinococcales bacterium]
MSADAHYGAVFGGWLQRRRRQLDLTQVELADRARCSVATIRKLESDERHPSERMAGVLAGVLGVADEERSAFVRFARGGWADRPPVSTEPVLDRPWMPGVREQVRTSPVAAGPLPPREPLAGVGAPSPPPTLGSSALEVAASAVGDAGAELTDGSPGATHRASGLDARVRLPETTLRPPQRVGREALWAELERAWSERRHVFLSGPGGIGKTRLMGDFATSKGPTMVGEGFPGDPVLPFSTMRRGYRRLFEDRPEVVAELSTWVRAELSRFLPELFTPPRPPVRDEAERLRFFEAVLRLSLVMSRHVAMVTADDLQYFDRSSFEATGWATSEIVRRGLGGARSIAAFRPAGLPPDYQAVVEVMVGSGISVLIDVGPLSEAACGELLTVLGVPPGELDASEVFRLTGGNPTYVIEAVKGWWETRELRGGVAQGERLALTAARTIHDRLDRLLPGDLRLAQAIAVLRDAATPELIAEMVDETAAVVAGRLARLEALNMVREGRFVHDLLEESARASLSAPQRSLLHARAAQALIARDAEPARAAHHLEQAGRVDEALSWRLEAAERALEQGSRIEARRWLGWVLERAPRGSERSARAGLLLGGALLSVDVEAAHRILLAARADARRAASPSLEARALAGLAQAASLRGDDAAARSFDHDASEIGGALPPRERAGILLALSEVRWAIGDFGESHERIAEAVRLDPSQPRYRLTLARFQWHRGCYEAGIAELEAVLQLDPASARLTRVLHDLGQDYRALGLLDPARRWLERALDVWADSGDLLMEARVRETLGATHTSRGAFAEAERELVAAAELYGRHGAYARLAAVAPKRAYLRLLTGEVDAAYRIALEGLRTLGPE